MKKKILVSFTIYILSSFHISFAQNNNFTFSKNRPVCIVLIHGVTGIPATINKNIYDSIAAPSKLVGKLPFARYYWSYNFVQGLLQSSNLYTFSNPYTPLNANTWESQNVNSSIINDHLISGDGIPNLSTGPISSTGFISVMFTHRDGSISFKQQTANAAAQIRQIYEKAFCKWPSNKQPQLILLCHSGGGIVARTICSMPESLGGGTCNGNSEISNESFTSSELSNMDFVRNKTMYVITLATPHEGSLAALFSQKIVEKGIEFFESVLNIPAPPILADLDPDAPSVRELCPHQIDNYNKGPLHPLKCVRSDNSLIPIYCLGGRTCGGPHYFSNPNLDNGGLPDPEPDNEKQNKEAYQAKGLVKAVDPAVDVFVRDILSNRFTYDAIIDRLYNAPNDNPLLDIVKKQTLLLSTHCFNIFNPTPTAFINPSYYLRNYWTETSSIPTCSYKDDGSSIEGDGYVDTDGFVPINSSLAVYLGTNTKDAFSHTTGGNFYRKYRSAADYDNHGTITIRNAVGEWLRQNIIGLSSTSLQIENSAAGPYVSQTGNVSIWKDQNGSIPIQQCQCDFIYDTLYPGIQYNVINTPTFKTNSFKSLEVDFKNKIWAGSTGFGVSLFDNCSWDTIYNSFGMTGFITKAMKRNPIDSTIWIGMSKTTPCLGQVGGIYAYTDRIKYKRYLPSLVPPNNSLPSLVVRSLDFNKTDSSNWVGCSPQLCYPGYNGGLAVFNNGLYKTLKEEMPPDINGDLFVTSIASSLNGLVYVAIGRSCLDTCIPPYILIRSNSITAPPIGKYTGSNTPLPLTKSSSSNAIRALYIDKKKRLWVGGELNGIGVRDSSGVWDFLDPNSIPYINNSIVNFDAITEAPDGSILFGTTNGILVFNGETIDNLCNWKHLYISGISGQSINAIKFDFQNNMWMATNEGILALNDRSTLPEICNNGIDDNCNGLIDELDPTLMLTKYYNDQDGDGYGDELLGEFCKQPPHSSTKNGDCDDSNSDIYPGAIEICDGIDNNCDGHIDEGFTKPKLELNVIQDPTGWNCKDGIIDLSYDPGCILRPSIIVLCHFAPGFELPISKSELKSFNILKQLLGFKIDKVFIAAPINNTLLNFAVNQLKNLFAEEGFVTEEGLDIPFEPLSEIPSNHIIYSMENAKPGIYMGISIDINLDFSASSDLLPIEPPTSELFHETHQPIIGFGCKTSMDVTYPQGTNCWDFMIVMLENLSTNDLSEKYKFDFLCNNFGGSQLTYIRDQLLDGFSKKYEGTNDENLAEKIRESITESFDQILATTGGLTKQHATFNNLGAGIYKIYGIENSPFWAQPTETIITSPKAHMTLSTTIISNARCDEGTEGSFLLNMDADYCLQSFSYSINNLTRGTMEASGVIQNPLNSTSYPFNNLRAGEYEIKITDNYNQVFMTTAFINIEPCNDDGDPCTNDVCINGVCTHVFKCDDGCPLTIDVCDGSGLCVNIPPPCDDGCPLTIDSFDPTTCSCIHTPISGDDGCALTIDSFDPVNCVFIHTPVGCDDNCPLTNDVFDPVTCSCQNLPPSCDDSDNNTDDLYDSANCICTHTLLACDGVSVLTANAGPDQSNCLYVDHFFLSANLPPTDGFGEWTEQNGDCTFFPSANSPNVTVHFSHSGLHTFTWTITCGNNSSADVVNVFVPPLSSLDGIVINSSVNGNYANNVLNITICEGDQITFTRSGGEAGLNGKFVWYEGNCDPFISGFDSTHSVITVAPHFNTTFSILAKSFCNITSCLQFANITVLKNSTWFVDSDGDGFGDSFDPGLRDCIIQQGRVLNNLDCDDSNSSVHPGGLEVCNGLDDNCNGAIDEGVQSKFFQDADGDGFGDPLHLILACSAPSGFVDNSADCNDNDANVHPGAIEICNLIDDNCNGTIDEGVKSTFYKDADGDGYGNANATSQACSAPVGYVADHTDCNDNNASIHPGAAEDCNGSDDNCNGQIDEGVMLTFYRDADGDGFGNPGITKLACNAPIGFVADNTDCDDSKASVHPGASEICNGIDDNCNGLIDENTKKLFYRDADGDGYGYPKITKLSCSAPPGFVANNGDCNDNNPAVHPGATELCNGFDDNCNGLVDEGCAPKFNYFADADGDGFGDLSNAIISFSALPPAGYVSDHSDCDDSNAAIHPGAVEICNSSDDNCNGFIDEDLAPLIPGTISGLSLGVCKNTTQSYSVATQTGVAFNWSAPANAIILSGQGTNSVTVGFSSSFISGILTVTATKCITSAASKLSIFSTPQIPSIINGSVTVCTNAIESYTCPVVPGALTYSWIAPFGAQILSGQGTNAVTIQYPGNTGTGSILVKALNGCGSSANKSLAVTINGCNAENVVNRSNVDEHNVVPERASLEVIAIPNPSNNHFTVMVNSNSKQMIEIRIFDMSGRQLITKRLSISESITIGDELQAGAYIAEIIQGSSSKTIKLVKM